MVASKDQQGFKLQRDLADTDFRSVELIRAAHDYLRKMGFSQHHTLAQVDSMANEKGRTPRPTEWDFPYVRVEVTNLAPRKMVPTSREWKDGAYHVVETQDAAPPRELANILFPAAETRVVTIHRRDLLSLTANQHVSCIVLGEGKVEELTTRFELTGMRNTMGQRVLAEDQPAEQQPSPQVRSTYAPSAHMAELVGG